MDTSFVWNCGFKHLFIISVFSFTVLKDFVGFTEAVSCFRNRGNHATNPYFCNLTILSSFEQFQPVSQLLHLRISSLLLSYHWKCVLYNFSTHFIIDTLIYMLRHLNTSLIDTKYQVIDVSIYCNESEFWNC